MGLRAEYPPAHNESCDQASESFAYLRSRFPSIVVVILSMCLIYAQVRLHKVAHDIWVNVCMCVCVRGIAIRETDNKCNKL